ncbi:hypothetical protein MCERH3_00046 [Candidatus Nanopelagicaceae bacterium]
MGTLEALLQDSRHQNKPALVMGSSPTVKVVSNFPFDGIRIGVGDMPVRAPEFGPYDYWVCANSYYPLPWNSKHRKDIEDSGARTLIASMSPLHSTDTGPARFHALEEFFLSDFNVLYEQRHFHNTTCNPQEICCEVSERFELGKPIQELLGYLVLSEKPAYSEGATVGLHGYALAVLLGANPIYIAGIDLPTTTKKYRAYKNWFRPGEGLRRKSLRLIRDFLDSGKGLNDFGNAGLHNILNDFRLISELADSIGITTFCLSENSFLNSLENIHYLELK